MAHLRLTPGPVTVTKDSGPHVGEPVALDQAFRANVVLDVHRGDGLGVRLEGGVAPGDAATPEYWMEVGSFAGTASEGAISTLSLDAQVAFVRYRVTAVGERGATFDLHGETRST